MAETNPAAAGDSARQMFRLVDARVAALGNAGGGNGGGGCGCGGKGHAHASGVGGAAAGAAATQTPGMPELARHRGGEGGGCGCGGKGHGGHGRRAAVATAQVAAQGGVASSGVEELVVHSIPKVVRKAVLRAAADNLPVGDNLIFVTPHQPDLLFDHLQASEAHYRVETLEAGPTVWRYRVTRIS